jgi:hypothetical protein
MPHRNPPKQRFHAITPKAGAMGTPAWVEHPLPILIGIAAEREILPGFGGGRRSGESGLAGARRTVLIERRYRAAEVRIWVCSLGICSLELQPSTL